MKIIIVGATGTMGKYLTKIFGENHEVIGAAFSGGDIRVDITSQDSIKDLFRQTGPFDALISTAGPSYVGPWEKMTDKEFRKGIEGN